MEDKMAVKDSELFCGNTLCMNCDGVRESNRSDSNLPLLGLIVKPLFVSFSTYWAYTYIYLLTSG